MKKNLFQALWDQHVVCKGEDGMDLLAIDRIFLHDLCGTYSFERLEAGGYTPRDPAQVFATPDHTLATCKGRQSLQTEMTRLYVEPLRRGCQKYGITLFDDGSNRQGIVHIVGPETGLTLPGTLVVCGDSHTCTHGALGALAYGVGTNEVVHALATSCLLAKRPKTMEIRLEGRCAPDVDAMDIILYILSKYGIDLAAGYAVEYTGEVIRSMAVEDRFTICNLSIELGADTALIAPDEKIFAYLKGRRYAPKDQLWQQFLTYCREELQIEDSSYDKSLVVDVSQIPRQVSWGIHPGQTISVTGRIPAVKKSMSESVREGYEKAYRYMDLAPNQKIMGTKIDYVFIGSCANGRLSSLERAAEVLRGQKVAPWVRALVVPGSMAVKRAAEKKGLDRIFTEAGCIWGEPCCGLCVGSNGETVPSGKRCVSTTNRNFVGRQGVGARTHLASPRTAALAAVTGRIG